MFKFFRSSDYHYAPINNNPRLRSNYPPRAFLTSAIILLSTFAISFYAGRLSTSHNDPSFPIDSEYLPLPLHSTFKVLHPSHLSTRALPHH